MNLADTQIKQEFDADGYVAMYSFFEDNKIQEIKNEIDRYINDVVPNLPNHHVFYEDKSDKTTIKNLQQMFTYDDYFKKLIEESAIQEVASFVLGEKAVPKNLQYFNKPAGVGKPTPPHQDGYYFMLKKHNAVTCWLALEKVDEENGCIHYVKGSHLDEEYRPHGKSNILGFSQGVTDFGNKNDKLNTVSFPGEAGTFLVHNARTIHWAEGNKSKTRTRKALGFIYYGESAEEDKEAHEAYQLKLRKELEEKFNMNLEFNIPNMIDLKKSYDEVGYNHIPELFSSSDMDILNKEFERYIKDCVPKMKDQEVYYVDKSNKDTLMQMQKLEEYDKFFYDLFYNSKIKDLAANALGEDVVPRAMEYFNKPPGKSNPTPPHQDGYYFNLDNDKAVTGWLALEDVDDENGCIHYVRGSHKKEYRPHGRSEILGFSQGVTDFGTEEDKKNTVKFEGKAGMFLMHDAKIIHFASSNKSSVRSRRAFGFVYHGVSAKHDVEKGKAYQKKLHDELKEKKII